MRLQRKAVEGHRIPKGAGNSEIDSMKGGSQFGLVPIEDGLY